MGVSLYLVFYNKLLRPKRLRLLVLSSIFLIYLLAGSYVFYKMNLPIELAERKDLIEFREKFQKEHKCISKEDLFDYIELIESASSSGIDFVENSTDFTQNWKFGGETLFFTFTLLATIGYGHSAPLTENGKLFCIFYVAIGVPLTILILTLIVDRIEFNLTKNLSENYSSVSSDNKKYQYKKYTSIADQTPRTERRTKNRNYFLKNIYLQCFTIGLILIIGIYIIPALIFSSITELHWTFLDAIYYCYISVATIGFGDLVPGEELVGSNRNMYRLIITSVFLLKKFNIF